jgi:hypothetical protein
LVSIVSAVIQPREQPLRFHLDPTLIKLIYSFKLMVVNINLETWASISGLDGLANPWPQRKTKVPAKATPFLRFSLGNIFLGQDKIPDIYTRVSFSYLKTLFTSVWEQLSCFIADGPVTGTWTFRQAVLTLREEFEID